MPSPVTLRLDHETRQRISRIARRKCISKSEVIRQAIGLWMKQQESGSAPYEMLADLVGVVHGGNPKRSEETGRKFKELMKKQRKSP